MIYMQFPLPGMIEILPEFERLAVPEWAMEQLREAVIERLTADHDTLPQGWIEDTRTGRFDQGLMMQAAIAGWQLARGRN